MIGANIDVCNVALAVDFEKDCERLGQMNA